MAAPLATPAQLGNFIQQTVSATDATALQLLAMSSAMIRRYLDMTITQVLGDVELRTPRGGVVFLKEAPATNVAKVEVLDPWSGLWSTLPATAYNVDLADGTIEQGYVNTSGIRWPVEKKSWRVTYDHGFVTVPDDLAGVCVSVASRFYTVPAGVDAERQGQRQVKYSLTSDDFNTLERLVLQSYKWSRIS